MRYFKAKTAWNYVDGKWQKSDRIYKRDVTGKMWEYIHKPEKGAVWSKLRFNDARKIYSLAREIDEKEAFIEIL